MCSSLEPRSIRLWTCIVSTGICDCCFNQALDMYRFDRHLRLLMFNEIEKIEVAVRSAIVNITSRETGNPFWMTDPTCFYDANTFVKTKQLIDAELAKSREDFIEHFRNTYSDPYPPAWMLSAFGRTDQDIQQHQEQPDTQEDSPGVFAGRPCVQLMDDHHHRCPQQLRPSCSRMEPHICIASADPAAHDPPLDYRSSQPAESLFQPLHHQVFPQYHFAQQRHEGESRCPALHLPVHRRHRHGIPSRMGE